MPEMMGMVLWMEMLAKDARRPHEFQEVIDRNRLSSRMFSAMRRLCLRWLRRK